MTRILKVGLIGFGEQGEVHARYLTEHRKGDAQIVAVGGMRRRSLPAVSDKLKLLGLSSVPVYCANDDYPPEDVSFLRRMINAHPEMEAMIISTPHAMHYPQGMFCLEMGLHVLVDKPLSIAYTHAKEMVELAARKGVHLLVSNQRRYEDAYHYVGGIIREGKLGQMRSANGILSHQQGWMHGWRGDPELNGGGTLMSIGHHLIDTIAWMANENAAEANAYGLIDPELDVETHLDGLIKFESGFSVSFTINYGAPKNAVYERLQLWGTDGNITVDRFKPVYDRELPRVTHQTMDGRLIAADFSQGLSRKWAPTENFVNALLWNEPVLSSGEQNLGTMQIIEALYKSLKSGTRIVVKNQGDVSSGSV